MAADNSYSRTSSRRWWVRGTCGALIAAAILTVAIIKITGGDAPPASDVPVTDGIGALQQAQKTFTSTGGPGGPTTRYRYIELSGPRGMSPSRMLRVELLVLSTHGWRWVGNDKHPARTVDDLLTHRNDSLELRSTRQHLEVLLDVIRAKWFGPDFNLFLLSDTLAKRRLHAGEPALSVILWSTRQG